jgi:transposase
MWLRGGDHGSSAVRAGWPLCYGPNLTAAAIVLGSAGTVAVQQTAMLIHALLGIEVSAGFVARAAQRWADKLTTAGPRRGDEDHTARPGCALRRREDPVTVLRNDLDPDSGEQVAGAPHAVRATHPRRTPGVVHKDALPRQDLHRRP